MEEAASEEEVKTAPGEKPLNGERTLDVAAGWNKPARSSTEEAVERLRKPADGTKRRVGATANIRSCARVMSRRGKETHGRCSDDRKIVREDIEERCSEEERRREG